MVSLHHVQHADRAVGPRDYKQFGDKILVTSLWETIQGEGPFAGTPAVFIRLAGCNRGSKAGNAGCAFCDTFFDFDKGLVLSAEELADRAEALAGPLKTTRLVVITGGEPMMQDNVWHLVACLINSGFQVQMESNGDRLAPLFLGDPLSTMRLVVSPKAGLNGYGQLRDEVIERADVFKFLLEADPHSVYSLVPSAYLNGWRMRDKIMVSPITVYKRDVKPGEIPSIWDETLVDGPATRANATYAAAYAIQHGLRVSLQTHLWLAME
jgi:organic radical activating enzyme